MADFTKKAIKESLRKLLEERPLSRITVKDIAATCGINRNTFYYHYQDIPMLLMEIIREDADEIIGRYSDIGSIEESVDAVTARALEQRTVVMHIYHSINRDIYEHYIWELARYTIGKYFDGLLEGRKVSETDREMLIRSAISECFGMVTDWLEHDMDEELMVSYKRYIKLKGEFMEEILLRLEKEPVPAEK